MRIPADESFRDLERYFRSKLKKEPPRERRAALPEITNAYLAGMQSVLERWDRDAIRNYYIPRTPADRASFLEGRKMAGGDTDYYAGWWPPGPLPTVAPVTLTEREEI